MYEPIQHFLTLTIETVVILGYGGLIVHYIATLSTSKQMNLAEKQEAEITPKFVPILNKITSFPAVAECAATQELTAEQGLTSSLQVKAEFASNIQLDADPLNLPFIQVDSLTLRQCRTVIRALNSTLRERVLPDSHSKGLHLPLRRQKCCIKLRGHQTTKHINVYKFYQEEERLRTLTYQMNFGSTLSSKRSSLL